MAAETVEIENRVRRILLESPFAVLTTVDEEGRPHARWMSPIFASGSIKVFHSLAAPRSRKVAHLEKNPNVSWLFTGPAFDEVVALHGTALAESDPLLRAEIWEAMPEKQRAFILKNDDNLDFAIIVTEVRSVEYSRPRRGETVPKVLMPT